jgi:hypothetical protein
MLFAFPVMMLMLSEDHYLTGMWDTTGIPDTIVAMFAPAATKTVEGGSVEQLWQVPSDLLCLQILLQILFRHSVETSISQPSQWKYQRVAESWTDS